MITDNKEKMAKDIHDILMDVHGRTEEEATIIVDDMSIEAMKEFLSNIYL